MNHGWAISSLRAYLYEVDHAGWNPDKTEAAAIERVITSAALWQQFAEIHPQTAHEFITSQLVYDELSSNKDRKTI